MRDPPIRSLFIAANNPAVTNPDTVKTRRGLAREDLFTVVHDPFLSATARYADIVLPATTYLETEDFYRSYGSYYMQYGHRAVAPFGQSRSNAAVAQALAASAWASTIPCSPCRPTSWFRSCSAAPPAPSRTSMPRACATRGPVNVAPKGGQQFRTPSGKLEIYSETMAKQGVAPMPDWQPDPQEVADAARWPLRLLTAPGYFQSHTAFSAVPFLREREGAPFCILHPDEARVRGLADGQRCGCSTIAARSASCCASATRCSPASCWCPASAPTRRPCRAPSTCCARTAIPTSARAPPTRAPSWRCRPGALEADLLPRR